MNVKNPVKFCLGNLESVAELVKRYNDAITHSKNEIMRIMLNTALDMHNSRVPIDCISTMNFRADRIEGDDIENVVFTFTPSHNNYIYLEYKGDSASDE